MEKVNNLRGERKVREDEEKERENSMSWDFLLKPLQSFCFFSLGISFLQVTNYSLILICISDLRHSYI